MALRLLLHSVCSVLSTVTKPKELWEQNVGLLNPFASTEPESVGTNRLFTFCQISRRHIEPFRESFSQYQTGLARPRADMIVLGGERCIPKIRFAEFTLPTCSFSCDRI